jgi:kynurenine formamidase
MRWKNKPSGSNWGAFGEDDQIGKMHLLTPQLRREAVREVKEGIAFCLSMPLDYPGGSGLMGHRKPPEIAATVRSTGHICYNFEFSLLQEHLVDVCSDDRITLSTQYSTQWDSLAHWGQRFDVDGDGNEKVVYYNGFRAGSDIKGPTGSEGPFAAALSVSELAKTAVQGRGVLVDLARTYGETPQLVGYDALMQAMDAQRLDVRLGDMLCLYTGWADLVMQMQGQPDIARLSAACATLDGRDARLLNWLSDSGVVAVCTDNIAVEPLKYPDAEPAFLGKRRSMLPLHEHCLFKQGIHLAEMWYLGELAAWLHANRRSSFLLTAPPLRLPGAVGSPVTPVATV